jgi:hypothetical protein
MIARISCDLCSLSHTRRNSPAGVRQRAEQSASIGIFFRCPATEGQKRLRSSAIMSQDDTRRRQPFASRHPAETFEMPVTLANKETTEQSECLARPSCGHGLSKKEEVQ